MKNTYILRRSKETNILIAEPVKSSGRPFTLSLPCGIVLEVFAHRVVNGFMVTDSGSGLSLLLSPANTKKEAIEKLSDPEFLQKIEANILKPFYQNYKDNFKIYILDGLQETIDNIYNNLKLSLTYESILNNFSFIY